MPGRRQVNLANPRISGLASTNVKVSARAARIGLIIGPGRTELARRIPEIEANGASSITGVSLEYIVLQLGSLPEGSTCTAGTLEVFFVFLVLVGDLRMSWSLSAISHHYRKSLVFLAFRIREIASRS